MRNRSRKCGSCIRPCDRRARNSPIFNDMIATSSEKRVGTPLACAARCELHLSFWPGECVLTVCTKRWDKRSQISPFPSESHLRTAMLVLRIAPNYAPFCSAMGRGMRRVITGRARCTSRGMRERILSFSIHALLRQGCLARLIFQSSRNCPLLFSSTFRERWTVSARGGGREERWMDYFLACPTASTR